MNYGVDEKKTVTQTCKGWDNVTTGRTERCGKRYKTKAAAPKDACPECVAKLVRQFWIEWEKDNHS